MSSLARHRAPGRASTPLTDINVGLNAKTATVAVTAAGVALTALPADAATQATTARTATQHVAVTGHVKATKVRTYRTNGPKSASARVAAYYRSLSAAQRTRIYRSYKHYRLYHSHGTSYRSYLKHSSHFASAHAASFSVGGTQASNTQARAARSRLLSIMRRYEGIMYRYGGTTPSGFDCSGFTSYVYRQIGYSLPRTSSAQRFAGHTVSRSQGRPGDLVWMPGHVGIYLGNGMMFDSPRTGKAIGARKIWRSSYKIVRVIND